MEEGSYLMIQRGMPVRGTDTDLGSVNEVVADTNADVFRGIVLTHGLLPPRQGFLAAEHILSVTGGVVHVDIDKSALDALPPPSASDK
jgi:uncharacterized protein YrrD